MWQQWTNAFFGLSVVLAPFLGLAGDALVWTLAVLGISIAALGVWGAVAHEGMYHEFQERMT